MRTLLSENVMTQLGLGLDLSTKRTRKREFLEQMQHVVPWSGLIALIEPPIQLVRRGVLHFRWRRCSAYIFFSNGSVYRIRLWRKHCMTYRCTGSLRDSMAA